MPQIKSAIKRVKTTATANKRNAAELSKLRTAVRKFNEAVENDAKDVLDLEVKAARALDKAASKGLISKNKANRDKSRLSNKSSEIIFRAFLSSKFLVRKVLKTHPRDMFHFYIQNQVQLPALIGSLTCSKKLYSP